MLKCSQLHDVKSLKHMEVNKSTGLTDGSGCAATLWTLRGLTVPLTEVFMVFNLSACITRTLTAQLLLFVSFDAELRDSFDELCRRQKTPSSIHTAGYIMNMSFTRM